MQDNSLITFAAAAMLFLTVFMAMAFMTCFILMTRKQQRIEELERQRVVVEAKEAQLQLLYDAILRLLKPSTTRPLPRESYETAPKLAKFNRQREGWKTWKEQEQQEQDS